MLIDDDEDLGSLITELLEQSGRYQVEYLSSPKNALETAKKFKPHLIILDIMMPGMSGFQVLETLKDSDPVVMKIPVLICSGLNTDEARIRTAASYCEDFISKPFSGDELEEKIEEILKQQQT